MPVIPVEPHIPTRLIKWSVLLTLLGKGNSRKTQLAVQCMQSKQGVPIPFEEAFVCPL